MPDKHNGNMDSSRKTQCSKELSEAARSRSVQPAATESVVQQKQRQEEQQRQNWHIVYMKVEEDHFQDEYGAVMETRDHPGTQKHWHECMGVLQADVPKPFTSKLEETEGRSGGSPTGALIAGLAKESQEVYVEEHAQMTMRVREFGSIEELASAVTAAETAVMSALHQSCNWLQNF